MLTKPGGTYPIIFTDPAHVHIYHVYHREGPLKHLIILPTTVTLFTLGKGNVLQFSIHIIGY